MQQQIDRLVAEIIKDYEKDRDGSGTDAVKEKMNREFRESIRVTKGKKYIKIMEKRRVWGFVVAVDDDPKFKLGDILMAKSINGPARNHARGNIFDDSYTVHWTGPLYIS